MTNGRASSPSGAGEETRAALRRQLGKDRAGWALKIGMNAIYGTLASVLGAELHDDGRVDGWCVPAWASMMVCTGMPRAWKTGTRPTLAATSAGSTGNDAAVEVSAAKTRALMRGSPW